MELNIRRARAYGIVSFSPFSMLPCMDKSALGLGADFVVVWMNAMTLVKGGWLAL